MCSGNQRQVKGLAVVMGRAGGERARIGWWGKEPERHWAITGSCLCASASQDHGFPMTQTRALQLLFDLRYLCSTLSPRPEGGQGGGWSQDPRSAPGSSVGDWLRSHSSVVYILGKKKMFSYQDFFLNVTMAIDHQSLMQTHLHILLQLDVLCLRASHARWSNKKPKYRKGSLMLRVQSCIPPVCK